MFVSIGASVDVAYVVYANSFSRRVLFFVCFVCRFFISVCDMSVVYIVLVMLNVCINVFCKV